MLSDILRYIPYRLKYLRAVLGFSEFDAVLLLQQHDELERIDRVQCQPLYE